MRTFRRWSIWIGGLTGVAAFVIFLLCSETPKDIFTLLGALGTGLVAGCCLFLITRGIGMMVRLYLEGDRFQKWSILIASLAAITIEILFAWNGGWFGILMGLFLGFVTCVLILAAANVIGWVMSGFHQGRGCWRLAVLLVLISAFAMLGCYIGSADALGVGLVIIIIWLICHPHSELGWRRSPSRVGWFVGLSVWCVASRVFRHGETNMTLSHGFPWDVYLAAGAGLAAWGLTLFLAPFFEGPGKANGVGKPR
jgi:hypothetical protein